MAAIVAGTTVVVAVAFLDRVFGTLTYLSLFVHLEEVQLLREQRDIKKRRKSLRRKLFSQDREAMFSRSNIFGNNRKRRMASWLWSKDADFDRSAELVLRILGGDEGGKWAQPAQQTLMYDTTV